MHKDDGSGYCKKAKKAISKAHPDFAKTFKEVERLLNIHFCPKRAETPLHEGSKFFMVLHTEEYEIWRISVVVQGLKPGAWPRYWLGVIFDREIIVPLEMGRHKDYGEGENQIENSAKKKMAEYMKDHAV